MKYDFVDVDESGHLYYLTFDIMRQSFSLVLYDDWLWILHAHTLTSGIPPEVSTVAPQMFIAAMHACWAGDPADRPAFSVVVSQLAACLRTECATP